MHYDSRKIKGDHSKKVGGRSKSGPAATKKSMAKKPLGKPITHSRGQAGYQHR